MPMPRWQEAAQLEPLVQSLLHRLNLSIDSIGAHQLRHRLQNLLDHGWNNTDGAELVALTSLLDLYLQLSLLLQVHEQRNAAPDVLAHSQQLRKDAVTERALICGRWLQTQYDSGTPTASYQRRLLSLLPQALALLGEPSPTHPTPAELADILTRAQAAGGTYQADVTRLVAWVRHWSPLS